MVFKYKVVSPFQSTYLHLTIFTLTIFIGDVKVVYIRCLQIDELTIHFGVCIHFEKDIVQQNPARSLMFLTFAFEVTM